MTAETRVTRARSRMLLEHPWFGSLAMRLDVKPADCGTMETNGTELRYDPKFVAKLTEKQLVGVMAHEVFHCALQHPYRRGARDPQLWNDACDYAVNPLLIESGLELTADALNDPKYKGLAADVIYAQLKRDRDKNPNQPTPDRDGLSTGSFEDAPEDGEPGNEPGTPGKTPGPGMTAEDWQVAAEQATMVTKAAGTTPGDAARAAKASQQQPEDWRAILREFIEQTVPSDYSWNVPNRRHIHAGVYLPGLVKENLGRIAVLIDTSGSIDQPILDLFASELTAIVHEALPDAVDVVYCDHAVQATETFTPDDPKIELHARGGGGTMFGPAFEHLATMPEPPVCALYFTDLYGCDNDTIEEPPYPVLWVTGKHQTIEGPFGRTIRIDF